MTKVEIRRNALENRKNWTESIFASNNQCVHAAFIHFFEQYTSPARIMSFQSMEDRREVAMGEINAWLLQQEHALAFPVVNASEGSMQAYQTTTDTRFEKSAWGIWEPIPSTAIPMAPDQFDIILFPLLAVDVAGNRVGYGKGFYDRFCTSIRPDCLKIGLSLVEPVGLIQDMDAHDVPLDMVFSPKGCHFFEGFYDKNPFDSQL